MPSSPVERERRHLDRNDRQRRGRDSRSRSPRRDSRTSKSSSPTRRGRRDNSEGERRESGRDVIRNNDSRRKEDSRSQPETGANAEPLNGPADEEEGPPKEQPNFGLSGKLAAETKTFKGVVLKYHEPAEARKSDRKWRLYVFKGKEQIDLLHIHRQSAYLFGRDRVVADIPVDHPSCSKQHAVLQFRQVIEGPAGATQRVIKPFMIDLEATNGTFVNSKKIPASRYYELHVADVIKFGSSTREFVLLHEEADKA